MARQLTGKQQAFCNAYVRCLNSTEAARLAKYEGDDVTLASIGYENLRKPQIRAEIDRQMSELTMPPSEVVLRLSQHASTSMGDFIKRDGNLAFLDLEKAAQAHQLHLLKKFKITKRGIEIELYDAQSALVHLGRHYGLFTDKLQIEDWRSRAIDDIKAGRVQYQDLVDAFDTDLATELFTRAGVPVSPK